MKKGLLFVSALIASLTISAEVIRLDLSQPTNPESFEFNDDGMWTETWNDSDYLFFETQAFAFSHLLGQQSYGGSYWDGFTVSKATQDGEGYGYYSNMAKGGLAGEGTPYILAYYNEWWLIDDANEDMMSSNQIIFGGEAYYPRYVYLNNALVSYTNILEGGGAARPFKRGDVFEVWIQGITEDLDDVTDEKVIYRLADYTAEDSTEWFVNTDWEKVDLSELGQVYGLAFTVVSSDHGDYGTNTATYFALDALTITTTAEEEVDDPYEPKEIKVADFEDITLAKADTIWQGADEPQLGWNNWTSGSYHFQTYYDNTYGDYFAAATVSNQTENTFASLADAYHSASGGAYEGENFAVWYVDAFNPDTITFAAQVVPGFFINNTAYAVNSMINGDTYAKKFGKDDWFKLTINGLKDGVAVNAQVEVDLAKDGFYIKDWTYVDLTELGEINGIVFNLWSSDVISYDGGITYYMNTPAYFAMDNFGDVVSEEYIAPERGEFPAEEGVEDVDAAVKVVKVVRDGQVLIIREGKTFNILGAEL